MKVLGIIPSRYNSSRFPGKPLIDLNGKSMIQRVYEGASKASKIDKLIVATDDQRIYDEVLGFNGNVNMTNSNHQTGTDRCAEIIEKNPGYDIVINIQGDEPLVNPIQLNSLIQSFENNAQQEIATLAIRCLHQQEISNSNRIKVVCDYKNNALYFSRTPIPFSKKTDTKKYLRHIGLYAYRCETLLKIAKLTPCEIENMESLEQLRWLFYGYSIKVIETDIETPNIDSPEDIKNVLKHL